jgi:hypothetical protein
MIIIGRVELRDPKAFSCFPAIKPLPAKKRAEENRAGGQDCKEGFHFLGWMQYSLRAR